MGVVSLYLPGSRSSGEVESKEIESLNETLTGLFSPSPFSELTLSKMHTDFGDWLIESSAHGSSNRIKVNDFVEELSLDKPSQSFRKSLAAISSAPKADNDLSVSFFNLSRFCEVRAAICALALPEVSNAFLAAPNSKEDRAKADLTLEIPDHKNLQIQVKARQGKESRITQGIPTLRDVLLLSFSELKSRIGNFIHEHRKHSA